jgi:hypothetical protein
MFVFRCLVLAAVGLTGYAAVTATAGGHTFLEGMGNQLQQMVSKIILKPAIKPATEPTAAEALAQHDQQAGEFEKEAARATAGLEHLFQKLRDHTADRHAKATAAEAEKKKVAAIVRALEKQPVPQGKASTAMPDNWLPAGHVVVQTAGAKYNCEPVQLNPRTGAVRFQNGHQPADPGAVIWLKP